VLGATIHFKEHTMPNATVRAPARTLPEDIQALEAAFEAAWKVESKATGDAAVRVAIDRTGAVVSKILNLAKTGVVPVRLLARLHIWGEFSRVLALSVPGEEARALSRQRPSPIVARRSELEVHGHLSGAGTRRSAKAVARMVET
jgi:hypothetical protein